MSKSSAFADMANQGVASQAELDATTTNLAVLAIRQAADHNDVKYSLQDRIIDTYYDASGIDASPSTNHVLTSGVYSGGQPLTAPSGGDSTDTSVSGYTTLVFTTSRALTVVDAGNVSILVVGGGGSGGAGYGGGGGAGGLVYDAVYALTPNTYDMVVGAGGDAITATAGRGDSGDDSTVTINSGSVMQFTAKGGGGGAGQSIAPLNGGSGGGTSYDTANQSVGATTQNGTTQGVTPDVSIGYAGGLGSTSGYKGGGGGGAGGAGGAANAISSNAGWGGLGYDASAIFGTAVGENGYFASGGGSGAGEGGGAGQVTDGGGSAGGATSTNSVAAQNGTGGGSGSAGYPNTYDSGAGGTGVILVRYLIADFAAGPADLILQSTDTDAETEADYADMVMLIEDTGGTPAVVNTDVKGFISEDSGVTFTEGVLVDEGDWGTNKRILAFHDLDISAQSGTEMCYKITTHNQAVGKQTKIHATSIGWK